MTMFHASNTPAKRQQRKEAGLCVSCNRKAEPGRIRCATCLQSQCKTWRSIARQRAAAGICQHCGKPLSQDELEYKNHARTACAGHRRWQS